MIRGLLLVVQVLVWLLLLRFLMRTLGAAFSRRTPPSAVPGAGARPQVRAAEDLVLDGVCHTYVPRSRAIRGRVGGREELFCSAACRDRARAAVA